MSGNYYYLKRGDEIFGPALPRQLIAAAEKGIIVPSDDLSTNRDGPWRSAATCVDLWEHEQEENSEDDEECFVVWEGPERFGPFSRNRLRALLDSDQLSPHTYVADADGRLTRLGQLLGIADPPAEPKPAPAEAQQTKQKRKKPKRKSRQERILNDLLRSELRAPPVMPGQVRVPAETKPKPPASDEAAAADSHRELTFIRTIRSRLRSNAFHQSYLLITVLIAVQSAAYLVAFGALTTEFLSRIFSLSIEVFAPFGSEMEQLQETDLAFAGVASVLLCAELLIPIFFLIRADADFRLWAIATTVGVIISLAITAEELPGIASAARWLIVVCGIGIACGALWIALLAPLRTQWSYLGLCACAVTAGGAMYLAQVDGHRLLMLDLDSLPPLLKGESTSALVPTGLSLLAVWLSAPLYCFHFLSSQADESSREYIVYYMRGTCVLGLIGLLSLGFLGDGVDLRYLSVPLALLPLTIGAVICAMTQPVMLILHPAFLAR